MGLEESSKEGSEMNQEEILAWALGGSSVYRSGREEEASAEETEKEGPVRWRKTRRVLEAKGRKYKVGRNAQMMLMGMGGWI